MSFRRELCTLLRQDRIYIAEGSALYNSSASSMDLLEQFEGPEGRMSGLSRFLTRGLTPSLATILITLLIVLTSPLLLHLYIYRSKSSTTRPTFLLVGPSGAGKSSLLTLVCSLSHHQRKEETALTVGSLRPVKPLQHTSHKHHSRSSARCPSQRRLRQIVSGHAMIHPTKSIANSFWPTHPDMASSDTML